MTENKTKVLIVGAGPTGLMIACQLSRYGINFRIIEKNSGPSDKSKALVVHDRTLEIYQQMGVDLEALEQGHQAKAVNLILKGQKVERVPLSEMGEGMSPFPFMHILEQNKNEKILIDFLDKQ